MEEEIKIILNDISIRGFSIMGEIGAGQFGIVYKAKANATQETCVLKLIPYEKGEEINLNEVEALRTMDHTNVIQYEDSWMREMGANSSFACCQIIKTKCYDTDLRKIIKENLVLQEDVTRRDIFRQIVDGLKYIHIQGWMHRDLKPENIFLKCNDDGTFETRIGDFGFARRIPSGEQTLTGDLGTSVYIAPEVKMYNEAEGYNEKSDLYALGIIFLEMNYPMKTEMQRSYLLSGFAEKRISRLAEIPVDFFSKRIIEMLTNPSPLLRTNLQNVEIWLNARLYKLAVNVLKDKKKIEKLKKANLNAESFFGISLYLSQKIQTNFIRAVFGDRCARDNS